LISQFVVADASVILKWYLQDREPHRAQALLLYDRFRAGNVRILLPELAMYELGNRLIRLSESGLQLFGDVVDLLTDIVPFESGDWKLTAACAESLQDSGLKKITMYDCAYIHLARVTDCPLLTADRLQAAGANTVKAEGILIEDYL
jgi:predicted nucleic acid-binding protein